MKNLFRFLFVLSLSVYPLGARGEQCSVVDSTTHPARTENELSPEVDWTKMRELYKHGVATCSDVLTAEARLLQEKSASGTDNAEELKRLREIYNELIRIAQANGDKKDSLKFQIRLLELSPDVDNRKAILACYKQLLDCQTEEYKHGIGNYVDVLLAEIELLKASLPSQHPDQAKKTEEEIREKQNALKKLYDTRLKYLSHDSRHNASGCSFHLPAIKDVHPSTIYAEGKVYIVSGSTNLKMERTVQLLASVEGVGENTQIINLRIAKYDNSPLVAELSDGRVAQIILQEVSAKFIDGTGIHTAENLATRKARLSWRARIIDPLDSIEGSDRDVSMSTGDNSGNPDAIFSVSLD